MTDTALPLTTFERYLLWEDRPAYPWSIFARLRFSGRMDRAALEEAVRTIMPRHPLLAARLESRGGRPCWVVQPGAEPPIAWLRGRTGEALPPAQWQDLRRESGLRITVVEDGDTCDLTAQFHHACCDGGGMEVYGNDLLIAYALARGERGQGVQLPRLDPARLAQRGAYGLTLRSFAGLLPRQLAGLRGAARFFARAPVPLVPHQATADEAPPAPGYPATCRQVFTREETAALYGAARRLSVTPNDLLIRDAYLALATWRAALGARDVDGWLRLMIPINLRSPGDRLLPAANMVGSIFLDRRGGDFADPDALLAGIAAELRAIKDYRLGLIFTYSLGAMSLVPGALRRNARRDRCSMSGIFSNIGRPFRRCPLPREDGRIRAGELVVEGIEGVAPLRPYNCATFLVSEYAGRLTVMLHYDPRPVGAAQAGELVAEFARRVRTTASGAG